MKIHKEGIASIILATLLVLIVGSLSYYLLGNWAILVTLPFVFIWMLIVWFFRNPERVGEFSENDIVAPVDGTVVEIKEVYEKEILKENCLQVSIFMSPLNVHVCRYPVNGKVIYTKYHKGKYLVAFHEKSSELNERTTVCVENSHQQKIAFRQIAGFLARRIVLYAKEGDNANAGKEYGFIKFGSRLDIFLPLGTELYVEKNAKTVGGKQIIGKLTQN